LNYKVDHAPRPTLKHIAARVRLSLTAVSMALRNDPSLPAKTIARVKKVADELGYTPDPALSALAAYRFGLKIARDYSVIALVSNWRTSEWPRHPSALRIIEGATARARTYGYAVQHFWAREGGMDVRRFGEVLAARGIRAIILAPFERHRDEFTLDFDRFTVVTIERPEMCPHFPHVVPNYFADTLLAWQQLSARGHRRVGLVIDREFADRSAHQWEAAHEFQQSRLVSESERIPTLVVPGSGRVEVIRNWLRRHRPNVVLSRSKGVLAAATAEHLRVPQDLGYVSLNALDDGEPHVTGILQHRDFMGATAVDLLHNLLHRNFRGSHEISLATQVNGTWTEGRTLLPSAAPAE
jgi:LacI family transcriptional regulator